MSSILEAPNPPVSSHDEAPVSPRTLEDLVQQLGGIPLSRVRLIPAIGQASESDLLASTHRLCELAQGTVLEKGMGFFESVLASVLVHLFRCWPLCRKTGFVVGDGGYTRLRPGLVRVPDVAFFTWDRIGSRTAPRDPICKSVPNLAVEIVSASNTRAEMDLKRAEYFQAGVEVVWFVYPETITVEVWSTPRDCHISGINDTLDCTPFAPGLTISIREWFDLASEGE